jgi:uncharacterized protein (DUF2384 family)
MTRTEFEMEFTVAALGWVERELEMSDWEIGNALRVDPRTISRWRKREHAPMAEPRERLRRLTQLKPLLENSFRTSAHSKRWPRQPAAALKGRPPMSVLVDGDTNTVLVMLGTHASGAYV